MKQAMRGFIVKTRIFILVFSLAFAWLMPVAAAEQKTSLSDPRMERAAVMEALVCFESPKLCRRMHVMGPALVERFGKEERPYVRTSILTLRACNRRLEVHYAAVQATLVRRFVGNSRSPRLKSVRWIRCWLSDEKVI